jgi:cytochrome c peroxidase
MSIERWLLPLVLLAAACDPGGPREAGDPEEPGPQDAGLEAGGEARDAALSTSSFIPNNAQFSNGSGKVATYSNQGLINLDNDFFDDFGTNGRDCGTCHAVSQAWSISAADVQKRFDASGGFDPIFRLVDGANSPNANVATLAARRNAYSMLRTRGVIRVGLPVSPSAEFELIGVSDPYGFASASQLSLFRRPLTSANLVGGPGTFVMWDGRETQADFRAALSTQANNATLGHAQAAASLPASELTEIVDFETALFTAQATDKKAGSLSAAGARGGPQELASQQFLVGNFDLYNAWATLSGNDPTSNARRAIARGQALFNDPTKNPLGPCSGCHNVVNVGSSVIPVFFNIGVSAGARRTPDMPLYTMRRKSTGETIQTTDPGRALVTGLWADMDSFKVPSLRGLSARAPYFHNGSAKTLEELVTFYEVAVGFNFTPAEEADLVAFLKAL